jgi:hypothetical protein
MAEPTKVLTISPGPENTQPWLADYLRTRARLASQEGVAEKIRSLDTEEGQARFCIFGGMIFW